MKRIILFLITGISLISLLSISGCHKTENEIILYTSCLLDEHNYEICVVSENGSIPVNLTNNPSYDHSPVWSPDNTKIAFVSDRDGNFDNNFIFIMNADGSNQVNISNSSVKESHPVWSNDGKKLAYISGHSICISEINGSSHYYIAQDIPGLNYISWSPDNTKFAYTTYLAGQQDVWLVDVDTGISKNLADSLGRNSLPVWSPDSKKIAFTSDRNVHNDIYIIELASGITYALTDYQGYAYPPEKRGMYNFGYTGLQWFPDEKNLLSWLLDYDTRRWDLYKINIKTGEKTNLTQNLPDGGEYTFGSCSSDGKKLVFSIQLRDLPESGGESEIWMVHSDGSGLTRIKRNEDFDLSPSFQN